MKIQPYIEKLNKSNEFKNFKAKNPDSYFSAGFFVLDFINKKNMHQIDYFIPEKNKIQTFILDDNKIISKESEVINKKIPKKIESNINLDLDILKGLVEDEMKNRTITNKIQKIIAIIENVNGKLIWNLNCIANDMGVMKVHIDDKDHSILEFEKINLFDIMRKS